MYQENIPNNNLPQIKKIILPIVAVLTVGHPEQEEKRGPDEWKNQGYGTFFHRILEELENITTNNGNVQLLIAGDYIEPRWPDVPENSSTKDYLLKINQDPEIKTILEQAILPTGKGEDEKMRSIFEEFAKSDSKELIILCSSEFTMANKFRAFVLRFKIDLGYKKIKIKGVPRDLTPRSQKDKLVTNTAYKLFKAVKGTKNL